MKPSLSPFFLTKSSWCLERSSMTALMSISLKVVSDAASCWAETRRSAIRRRSWESFLRVWRGPGEAAGGAGASFGALAESMSALVTRPALPVPATDAGSTPVSSASLRTAGDITAGPGEAPPWRGAGPGAGAEPGAAAAGAPAAGGAAPGPASMEATTWPILTSAPSGAISVITPSASAAASDVILSVSNSKRGWSLFTRSPSFTCHFARMPVLIDSPICGILTSIGMARGCMRPSAGWRVRACGARASPRRARPRRRGPRRPGPCRRPAPAAGRSRTTRPCSGIPPGTRQASPWGASPRSRPGDRRVRHGVSFSVLAEVVVHLSRTEDQAARPRRRRGLLEYLLETARREIADPRDRSRMAKERLGRHHDQRLAEVAPDLPAQEVEVLGRRRHARDLDVVLRARLQEALQARRRVLGALALVAVRQQEDDAARPLPLGFAAHDELVDQDLGAVREVAELGLPQAEEVGVVERVAVVEAEHGRLGEQRIVDAEARLPRVEVPEGGERLARLAVGKDRVPVAEGSPLGVLPAQPDGRSLDEERPERERLAETPVHRPAVPEGLGVGVE